MNFLQIFFFFHFVIKICAHFITESWTISLFLIEMKCFYFTYFILFYFREYFKMVAGCGSNMLKYILFFLNFLICVSSVLIYLFLNVLQFLFWIFIVNKYYLVLNVFLSLKVLALAGVIASLVFILDPGTLAKAGEKVTQLKDLNDMLSSGTIHVGLYVILGASVVILIISFFGCCGAWKEIKCMLGLVSWFRTFSRLLVWRSVLDLCVGYDLGALNNDIRIIDLTIFSD